MSKRDEQQQLDLQSATGRNKSIEDAIQQHYSREGVADVYNQLGAVVGDGLSIGNSDFVGWYKTRNVEDGGEGRPWALSEEWSELRSDVDRVVYATVSYATRTWYSDGWKKYEWVGDGGNRSREWVDGNSPTPGYGDLAAYAPFADIDLADGVKTDRPTGDIPREPVEEALGRYIDAFADLAGGREHVFALDSVGGAYVFVAPTSTAPIVEEFSREKRKVIFSAMMDELNEWLGDVRDEITADIPATEGVFSPDKLNNKNRLFKAPLSVHSSLDGVVTPVDTKQPQYDYTPLTAVDDTLLADSEQWADEFTADHSGALCSIVATLWPAISDGTDTWQDALEVVADDELAGDGETSRNGDGSEGGDGNAAGGGYTTEKQQLFQDLDDLNEEEVVQKFCDEWDVGNRDPPRFDPGYRGSNSGTSCFVNGDGKIVDLDDDIKAFGVVTYTAREKKIVTEDGTPTGSDWWDAVEELRQAGFDIRRYTGGDEISDYYAYPVAATAREHGYNDPFDDEKALLRVCLKLREKYDGLDGADPPYGALVALAGHVRLDFADPEEQIMGKTTYKVASRMYDELEPGDLGEVTV